MSLQFLDWVGKCVRRTHVITLLGPRTTCVWSSSIAAVVLILSVSVMPANGTENNDTKLRVVAERALALIDVLLEERTAAVFCAVHRDDEHRKHYEEQAKVTNARTRELVAATGSLGLQHPVVLAAKGAEGEIILDGSSDTREFVILGVMDVEQLLRSYGVLLDPLWDAIAKATELIQATETAATITARTRLMALKESRFMIRDLVEVAHAQKRLPPVLQLKLASYASTATQRTSEFAEVAGVDHVALYESLQRQGSAAGAADMRRQALAAVAAGTLDGQYPDWWKVQTASINRLAEVDEALRLAVQNALEGRGQSRKASAPRYSTPVLAALSFGACLGVSLIFLGWSLSRRKRQIFYH